VAFPFIALNSPIFPPESQQLLFIFRHEPEITYRIEGQRLSDLTYAVEGF
jgi:hypothetical protein